VIHGASQTRTDGDSWTVPAAGRPNGVKRDLLCSPAGKITSRALAGESRAMIAERRSAIDEALSTAIMGGRPRYVLKQNCAYDLVGAGARSRPGHPMLDPRAARPACRRMRDTGHAQTDPPGPR